MADRNKHEPLSGIHRQPDFEGDRAHDRQQLENRSGPSHFERALAQLERGLYSYYVGQQIRTNNMITLFLLYSTLLPHQRISARGRFWG